jgi:hypothetical protein
MSRKHSQVHILYKYCHRDSIGTKTHLEVAAGILLLFTATQAVAQFKSGTIIVVGYSKHKVVIAADSRKGSADDAAYRDDSCKITALNDKFLFAPSGRIVDVTGGIVGWDAADQAKASLATIMKRFGNSMEFTPPSLAGDVADLWEELIGQNIADHIRPEELAKLKPNELYVDGVFISVGETDAQVSHAVVRRDGKTSAMFSPPVETAGLTDKIVFKAFGGKAPTFFEFLNATSDRAKKESLTTVKLAKKWPPQESAARLEIRFVDLVIRYSPHSDVGGPVDAAELTVGHSVHWIQRKPNCKDN